MYDEANIYIERKVVIVLLCKSSKKNLDEIPTARTVRALEFKFHLIMGFQVLFLAAVRTSSLFLNNKHNYFLLMDCVLCSPLFLLCHRSISFSMWKEDAMMLAHPLISLSFPSILPCWSSRLTIFTFTACCAMCVLSKFWRQFCKNTLNGINMLFIIFIFPSSTSYVYAPIRLLLSFWWFSRMSDRNCFYCCSTKYHLRPWK